MKSLNVLFLLVFCCFSPRSESLAGESDKTECSDYHALECNSKQDIQKIYEETNKVCNLQRIAGKYECNSFLLGKASDCKDIPVIELCEEIADLQGVDEFSCEWKKGHCKAKQLDQ
jgi:hypothetical protein